MKFILIILFTFASIPSAQACCGIAKPEDYLDGEFKILKIERAVLTCRINEDGDKIAPSDHVTSGCVVTATFHSPLKFEVDRSGPIKFYSRSDVCAAKVGDTAFLNVELNCSAGTLKGLVVCEGSPPQITNRNLNEASTVTTLLSLSWIEAKRTLRTNRPERRD